MELIDTAKYSDGKLTPFGKLIDLIQAFRLFYGVVLVKEGLPELPFPILFVTFGNHPLSVDAFHECRSQDATYPVNQALFNEHGNQLYNQFSIKMPSNHFLHLKSNIQDHESWEIHIGA